MAEKLLVNVAHEETRVALVESGRLANFEIITSLADNNKGSIFKGIVHRVNASLQAAFVDYGADKQGFLPLAEVHPRYYPKSFDKNSGRRPTIMDVLNQGQEVMVQVVKDEIGQKGATLTTYISLAGRSLAIEADSDKAGISRRVSQDERNRLRKVMNQLEVPDGFGAIMRTAAADQDDDDIHSNQHYLMQQWTKVQERFKSHKGPGLIHQELPLPMRFIRDSLSNSVDEILVDDKKTYEEVRNFCVAVAPELVQRVKFYDDPRPLFFRFQIEDQIDDIFARKIDLPSGGSIVIDQAEALVAIDVNSGRVKTDDIEDTATKTNLEAAAEIARQLKIRDRGGLIVVDFIDMREKDNIKRVEEAVRQAFSTDKAKVKFSRISEFGLMEISRQRLQSSVMRGSFNNCAHCGGTGQVRSIESSTLFILRRLKETLIRGNYERVEARLPVGVANYLLNRKRQDLVALERQTGSAIEVIAEERCPPMKAWVELIARPGGSSRKARRIVQEIDLVRSEVEKRDLEDHEVLVVDNEPPEPEASAFAASRDKLDAQNRALEGEIARKREVELAQKEADESLRRQEELRLEKDRVEAEAERIRALDNARRASLGLWGRIKAFFGGLPPIDPPRDESGKAKRKRDDRRPEKKRDESEERTEERREDRREDRREEKREKRRDDRGDRGDRGEKKREDRPERSEKTDKAERPERGDKPRGDDDRRRTRYPAKVEGGAGELVEAGGAAPGGLLGGAAGVSAEAGRKKRRRRRGGKGRDGEGAADASDLEDSGSDEAVDETNEATTDVVTDARAPRDTDSRRPRGDRPERADRGDRPERADRGDRPERADRGDRPERADRGDRPERGDRAARGDRPERRRDEATETPAQPAASAPDAPIRLPERSGVVDLRPGRARTGEFPKVAAESVAPARPVTPPPTLPKFGGVIDLRGGAPTRTAPTPALEPSAHADVAVAFAVTAPATSIAAAPSEGDAATSVNAAATDATVAETVTAVLAPEVPETEAPEAEATDAQQAEEGDEPDEAGDEADETDATSDDAGKAGTRGRGRRGGRSRRGRGGKGGGAGNA
jgi:ribonuclease E